MSPKKIQAVILAAGKSTRIYPLTITKPKPLLKVANKPILAHNLDQLVDLVDEAIIIVGYKKEKLIETFGNEYKGIKLIYAEQKEQLGSGHALLQSEPFIRDQLIMMVGDDLFSRVDIEAALAYPNSALGMRVEDPTKFGVLVHKDGKLLRLEEKPQEFVGDLASTGLHVFTSDIFDCLKRIQKSTRGELEVSAATNLLLEKMPVQCIETKGYWIPVAYPWNLLQANEFLLQNLKSKNEGEIEPGAVLKGNVVVGKGTVIRSGAYIEGPTMIGENCLIAPATHIRAKTAIGNNVIIGHSVEIKNSIIMDGSVINHGSYIGDSVIGEKVDFGSGSIVANWRHDGKNVKSVVKAQLVDTGRQRFGTVIGDCARIAIKTGIYPGRKIWPCMETYPGEILKNDLTNKKKD
jgi:bifunctional UDP-N-acetylglucosamine pyrophosphorylase/glucosamine-1-phosphate N-acetyltransferase